MVYVSLDSSGVVCAYGKVFIGWGGASIAYFFITGGLILKLNPWLYMGTEAKKGNQVASEQLHLIEMIQVKRETYNAEQEA